MMKKEINLTVILSILSLTMAFSQTSFTGTWVLNKAKTDFGPAPHTVMPVSLKVMQTSNAISIISTSVNADGLTYKDTAKLIPGMTANIQIPIANRIHKSDIKWNETKDGFTVSTESLQLNNSLVAMVTDQWALDNAGGKELFIRRTVKQPNSGEYEIRAYYDKQQ